MKEKPVRSVLALLLSIALGLAGCGPSPPPALPSPTAAATPAANEPQPSESPLPSGLRALPGLEKKAPKLTQTVRVTMTTSAGVVQLEVYPQAAPKAAKRFLTLARSGFYNQIPVSRVIEDVAAQFGVNWRKPHKKWQAKTFDDDPSRFSLERGTLVFAKTGPDTSSTQVIINLRDNSRLAAPKLNYTAFAKVIQGMAVVDRFAVVGDPNGGLDQGRLWNDGASYLWTLGDKPTMIESMVVEE
jgi:cyclophilin family peptidyl-prolyl cis-trans isomerase